MTYQGLTGAPAIALKGGEANAPALTGQDHQPPVLMAGPGVGQNLTEAARGTLHNIDTILADNSKDLHTAISGFSTFADMLGRNSKRLEGIIGGLEKLTGGGEKKPVAVLRPGGGEGLSGARQRPSSSIWWCRTPPPS